MMQTKTLPALLAACLLAACAAAPDAAAPQQAASQAAASAPADFPEAAAERSERTEAASLARIKKPAEKIIAYYDADGKEQNAPAAKGFYRILMGTTANGEVVIRDYYQDSLTKQTTPIVLSKAKSKSFDAADSEGRTVWYRPDGSILYFGDFHGGRQVRSGYYQEGRLVLKVDNSANPDNADMTGYYPDGKRMFEIKADGATTLYYRNGKKLSAKSADKAPEYWRKNGSPAKQDDVLDELLTTEKRIQNLIRAVQKSEKPAP